MSGHPVRAGSIVVGVDGSEHARRALDWAVDQAQLTGRRLAIVHSAGRGERAGVLTDAVGHAEALAADLEVTGHRIEDDPRDALVGLSREASMVVLGSRGLGVVRTVLVGSVSAAVARHASCPVVVCRPAAHRDGQERVVVGADGSLESLPVIEFAFAQASLCGAPLTVMHCFYDVATAMRGPGTVAEDDPVDVADLRLLLAESVAGLSEKFPDVVVTRELARGLVDVCLAGQSPTASLLVVGRTPDRGWSRFLHSSCALAVLENSDTAVAVVPETPSDSYERNPS